MRDEALQWWTWALQDNWPRRHYSTDNRAQVWDAIAALRYCRNPINPVLGLGWARSSTVLYRNAKKKGMSTTGQICTRAC